MRRKDPFRELSRVAVSVCATQVSVLFRKERRVMGETLVGPALYKCHCKSMLLLKKSLGSHYPGLVEK